jgi:hypothetical protein
VETVVNDINEIGVNKTTVEVGIAATTTTTAIAGVEETFKGDGV